MHKVFCFLLLAVLAVACNTAPENPVRASVRAVLSDVPVSSLSHERASGHRADALCCQADAATDFYIRIF
jgi:uncharacterized protein YcfL